jgi:hypothetical protein
LDFYGYIVFLFWHWIAPQRKYFCAHTLSYLNHFLLWFLEFAYLIQNHLIYFSDNLLTWKGFRRMRQGVLPFLKLVY